MAAEWELYRPDESQTDSAGQQVPLAFASVGWVRGLAGTAPVQTACRRSRVPVWSRPFPLLQGNIMDLTR
jgi:hypothetical protein